MELQPVLESIRSALDRKTAAHERGLTSSRSAIRSCGNAIRALHRYEIDAAGKLLEEAQAHLDDARQALGPHNDILYAGFVQDAEKEVAEARITYALVTQAPFPTPDQLGIEPAPYLKGMAEAIGELRHHILDLMRQGELQRCEELLRTMDDMYYRARLDGLSRWDHAGFATSHRYRSLDHRTDARRLHHIGHSELAPRRAARARRHPSAARRLTPSPDGFALILGGR